MYATKNGRGELFRDFFMYNCSLWMPYAYRCFVGGNIEQWSVSVEEPKYLGLC